MRKRTKRDLILLVLLVAAGAGTVFATREFSRGGFKEEMNNYRRALEKERADLGVMRWEEMRSGTKGGRQEGAQFDEDFAALEGDTVNLIGFMTPLYKFSKANEFMLLPVPIECYFCQRPPLKDIMYVSMEEGRDAKLVQEPVIIHGKLQLNEEPGLTYFYQITDAKIGPAKKGGRLTARQTSEEARQHAQAAEAAEMKASEELLRPEAPPKPGRSIDPETDPTPEP